MAIDAALLERATGRISGTTADADDRVPPAVWRCYSWSSPTVSFGRNESTMGRFSTESIAAAGLEAVRRPTGGRALLHAREITYSVALPLATGVPWRVAYDAINRLLRDALRSIGIDAEIVPDGVPDAEIARDAGAPIMTGPLRPDGPLCFDRPAPGEIVVGQAKLAAGAVWRERGAFLQHGSILLHDDQRWLLRAACAPLPEPAPGASLHDVLPGESGDDALRDLVERAIERQLLIRADVTPVPAWTSLQADIARWANRLSDSAWLWRR